MASALGDAVVCAANGISSIHAAGIPWYLSIPAAALCVNFTFRLPIQYYARRLVIKRGELTPLVSAWSARHAATAPRSTTTTASTASTSSSSSSDAERVWTLRVASQTEKSRRGIYKAFGVQRYKTLAPLLSMLPFITVSEAIRRLCGAPTGWITHSVGLAGAGASPQLFEAALRDGGCLWFVDLTAMDPYYALPALCSALLAKTAWTRLSKEQLRALLSLDTPAAARSPMMRMQTGLGRVLLLVPLVPMLFADLPSAVFLYWASTFALNDINEAILGKLLPRKAPKLKLTPRTPPALPYLRGDARQ